MEENYGMQNKMGKKTVAVHASKYRRQLNLVIISANQNIVERLCLTS